MQNALLAKKRKATPHAPHAGGPGILGAAPPPPDAQAPIGKPPQRPNVPRAPGAPRTPQVSTAERLAQRRREKK